MIKILFTALLFTNCFLDSEDKPDSKVPTICYTSDVNQPKCERRFQSIENCLKYSSTRSGRIKGCVILEEIEKVDE